MRSGWRHFDSPATVAACLRSWEERFGAVLAGIGFDTTELMVQHPPRTAQQCGAVIVTGDDDLLAMDLHPPAMTPRALLDWLRSHLRSRYL